MADIDRIKKDWAYKHREYLEKERVVREINEARNKGIVWYDKRLEVFKPVSEVKIECR